MIKLSKVELAWIAGALRDAIREAEGVNHPLSQFHAENLKTVYDKIVCAVEQDAKRIEVGV